MNYKQLKEEFIKYESKHPVTHLTAYITFASFGPKNKTEYSWSSRTYRISSDNKAFQPNMGGYSIFGSCLDGTDPGIRLEKYMAEEQGGKDGWIVEDCCIFGHLLIECSDINIWSPKMFYAHSDAADYMLSQLAEKGEFDLDQLREGYAAKKDLFEEGRYGVDRDSAWLAGSCEDFHWKIQPVCIYGPLKMVFPETEDTQCPS